MPKIQMRRDSAANWKSANPTLLAGEWALETDTKKMKIGDGNTAYNSLEYFREEDNVWQKPTEWMDIRSGALPNSVYFWVGHSADYSSYPQFGVYATVSNSGTYDVYVDGIKQATTASGTATTLDWQTLALPSGYDVTYPSALRTHVVRVAASASSNSITAIKLNANTSVAQGVLWIHFTLTNAVELSTLLTSGADTYHCSLLEIISSEADALKLTGDMNYAFARASNLKQLPLLDVSSGVTGSTNTMFANCTSLNKVHIKGSRTQLYYGNENMFLNCNDLKEIQTEDSYMLVGPACFSGCNKLKQLPVLKYGQHASTNTAVTNFLKGCENLKYAQLDASEGTTIKRFTIGGSSSSRIDGLKGLTVSNQAPFDSASSPQLDVSYTGLDRGALVNLFNSMPTVSAGQVCDITGTVGADDLTAGDLAVATNKGWTVTR